MQHVKLFSESVEYSCRRVVGASSSEIAESEIESSSTTGAILESKNVNCKATFKESNFN